MGGRGQLGRRFGQSGIDDRVELRDVHNLGPAMGAQDDDRGGLLNAETLAEGIVGLDFGGETSGGIYDEGHLQLMGGKPLACELVEVILGGDGVLRGEDVAAELFGYVWRYLVEEITGGDGGVPRPFVHLEGEIVVDQRDLVVLDSCVGDGKGVGAGWAFKVVEVEDGDVGPGRQLEH